MSAGTLSKKQFDILVLLEKNEASLTQRGIAEKTGMSVGSVNRTVASLTEMGLISGNTLTAAGYEALEPYRVKRAVFIAAGFGSRMVPVTLNTPKPLVRVNGKRMIDTLLDAITAVGIEEVYIVRGYLGEQFDQLLYKYPNIKFIDNPLYNEANNISSILCAREKLQNTYILEADLVLYNPELITKYQYMSNYLGVPVEKTDDWCLLTNKSGIVTKIQIGGVDCYHLFGISYWTEEDGAKLCEDVKKVYEMPGGRERYWDQVPLEYCISNYQVGVRECTFEDIIEIDSYNELKKLDKAYL
ncbi:MAG: NTP transferase domain-containing protein [Clostridia bacterium]|nr:NTP transferase domain-containing protein [Clostridia bacterium]